MICPETLTSLFQALKTGAITRRQFVQRSAALGLSAAGIAFAVNSLDMRGASAQEVTTTASAGRPAVGMESATRGEGAQINVLLWQAVTHLSPHNATGTKDTLGASFVLESLMNYVADASLVPTLITEVPTVENGMPLLQRHHDVYQRAGFDLPARLHEQLLRRSQQRECRPEIERLVGQQHFPVRER